ncbi:hypothetical protein SHELI_v1c10300 [Spiroplasma helicoides]|uniref:Uncharacterized protein n=1 Tax=Spiroplasma helicoides TaxID=216938 RepID=A0A1B3SM37_9MOLU|nr:lipoprotein [Spiroplasma helicoides]AOG60977.1 hypothetical protein SHELI_v1c10300 [Spiroplasma helicoides]
MKKLLSLLAATGLVATSSSVAVACNKNNDASTTQDDGKIIDLSEMSIKELGDINGSEATPSVATIVKAINAKNSNYGLAENDVEFEGAATNSKATIKAKTSSSKFINSVEVTYSYNQVLDLSKLQNKELGEVIGRGTSPVISDLIRAITLKNSSYNLSENDVEIDGSATNSKATIKAKADSKKFTGSVEVTYTYKQQSSQIDLANLTTKDLGEIKSIQENMPSLAEIVKAINEKNENTNLTELDVELGEGQTNEKATINAKSDSPVFKGTVEVTYTYKAVKSMDMSLVEQAIKGEGDFGAQNPAICKLGITIDPDKNKDEEQAFATLKDYTQKLLNLAAIQGLNLDLNKLLEMITLSYYSDDNSSVLHKNGEVIKSFKISLKEGMNYHIDGYYVTGEIKARFVTKVDINTVIVGNDIGEIEPKSSSAAAPATAIKDALKVKYANFLEENKCNEHSFDVDYKQVKLNSDKSAGTAILPKLVGMNQIFYNTKEVSFTVKK